MRSRFVLQGSCQNYRHTKQPLTACGLLTHPFTTRKIVAFQKVWTLAANLPAKLSVSVKESVDGPKFYPAALPVATVPGFSVDRRGRRTGQFLFAHGVRPVDEFFVCSGRGLYYRHGHSLCPGAAVCISRQRADTVAVHALLCAGQPSRRDPDLAGQHADALPGPASTGYQPLCS